MSLPFLHHAQMDMLWLGLLTIIVSALVWGIVTWIRGGRSRFHGDDPAYFIGSMSALLVGAVFGYTADVTGIRAQFPGLYFAVGAVFALVATALIVFSKVAGRSRQ